MPSPGDRAPSTSHQSRWDLGGWENIRTRVVLVMFLMIMLPGIGGALLVFRDQRRDLTAEAVARLEAVASVQLARIEHLMRDDLEEANGVRVLPGVVSELEAHQRQGSSFDAGSLVNTLFSARDARSRFVRLFVVGLDGSVIASTDKALDQLDLSGDQYVAKGRYGLHAGLLFLDESGVLVHRIASPVATSEGVAGIIVVDIDQAGLLELVGDYTGLGRTGETLIAVGGSAGEVVFVTPLRFDPDAAFRLSIDPSDFGADPASAAVAGTPVSSEAIHDYRGRLVLSATGQVPLVGWGVVVKIDAAEALSRVGGLRTVVLLSLAASALVATVLAWIGSGWLVRPIKALTVATEAMTAGDLGIRTHIDSPAEMAALSTAFNQMAEDLARDRALLEARVEHRTAELAASNKDLERLAEVAAHDLSAPLRRIQTYASRITDGGDESLSSKNREYFERMAGSAERMRLTLDGLLELSRITAAPDANQPVDMNSIVAKALSDLESETAAAGARVEVGELPTVIGDPARMLQLLQNLIGNAIKFHRPDEPPVVRVYSHPVDETEQSQGRAIRIVVADNGLGFEPDQSVAIFEMFQRLHSGVEGSGLGLATCRRIVEQHGGSIEAVGTPGVGSKFVVTLPSSPSQPSEPRPESGPGKLDDASSVDDPGDQSQPD